MANLSARKAEYSRFQELNVQNLGIGAGNPFSQKTLADSLKLPYPLLSDFPDLKVIKSFGVLSQARQITARRSFFLVDKEGIVRGKWLPDESLVFPSETVLEAVRAIAGKP
ncbi:MAG: redoxin domain-containing protein [candidate division NC10 bacterium]|nr:redoxin domain-containing protein [candidate division NC10 bacterium]